MRYRHKPTVIEAVQWNPPLVSEEPDWIREAIDDGRIEFISYGSDNLQIVVRTPEGQVAGKPGIWVTKGVSGELYLIQPKLFEQLYEFDADEVVDMWAGNWIVTIEAPNGLVDSYYVDPQLVERSHMPAADMILGPAPAKVRELFDRRNEEKTDA
jgi:hypothetical protein